MVDRICEHCTSAFRVHASVVRKGKGRFCSRPCTRAAKADRRASLPEAERFWAMVDRSGGAKACWPWLGATDKGGYGQFSVGRDGDRSLHDTSHRVALRLTLGRAIDGWGLHSCDNPPCCNPAHLREGSRAENNDDALARHRFAIGERHGSARLTDDDVRIIRAHAANGESLTALATSHGVALPTVSDIVHRRTWSWLE